MHLHLLPLAHLRLTSAITTLLLLQPPTTLSLVRPSVRTCPWCIKVTVKPAQTLLVGNLFLVGTCSFYPSYPGSLLSGYRVIPPFRFLSSPLHLTSPHLTR